MSDDDIALSEKRMYGEKRPETHAYVASGLGVTRVETAGGQVGRFSLDERCTARDVAGSTGEVAVATDDDVLVTTDDGFAPTDFGPATAVGYDSDGLLAAGEDGTVARYADGEWTALGTVADVRAIDDGLLGAEGGVYALPALDRLALADVTDVAPGYAATTAGLYERDDDAWTEVRSGHHQAVASDGERVHAAADGGLFELVDGAWDRCALPVDERVVDVVHGVDTYAVTEAGTFLVEADAEATADGQGGWRRRSLGVPEVVGVAVA